MSNILITGGTGNLGKSLLAVLKQEKISFTTGGRNNRSLETNFVTMDLLKNEGVEDAVKDKTIIFHLATDLKKDTILTENLIKAIGKNQGVHLIYISIVGIDKVPMGYYKQKLASEQAVIRSGIPYTILRATQFHQFAEQIITTLLKFPVGILPKRIISQPIQTEIVARELYRLSLQQPKNITYEIGGSEIKSLEEMAREWQEETGKKRFVINLPIWGELGKSLRYGNLTTAKKCNESITWKEWLKSKL